MSIFDGYKREEYHHLTPGDYRVVITEVQEAVSRTSGNPMLIVSVKPNGSDITIKHYIVKNQWFNRNLTELKDSFKIAEGDNEILGWIGAMGAAKLIEDDNGYMKVRRFISPQRQADLPEWQGEAPQRQQVSDFSQVDLDDDDLPF